MADFVGKYEPPTVMRKTLYRPKASPLESPRQWWRYAIRSTILQLRFAQRSVCYDNIDIPQNNDFIEELRYEANLLYIKETPLGLRLMTMEGLREEIEYLKNENASLRSMLQNSVMYESADSCKWCGRSFLVREVSIQSSLPNLMIIRSPSNIEKEGEENLITDELRSPTDENFDNNYEDDLDELPESSIEQMLDAAMMKKAKAISRVATLSTVTMDAQDSCSKENVDENKGPNPNHSSNISELEITVPATTISMPVPQQPKNVRKQYRSQLQQHINRMHRATIIRAAAAPPPSVHPDIYDTSAYNDHKPECKDYEIDISMENASSSHVRPKQRLPNNKDNVPTISRTNRSKQISRAYNNTPYVLRPSTRSPSRKKRKSKSPSHSRRSNSRGKGPESESWNIARSLSPAVKDKTQNLDTSNTVDEHDDAHSINSVAMNRRSKSPTRVLPVITADMSPVEKVAVEIIQRVRTHNGKKTRNPDVYKRLSPTEMFLLKSPFAQPVFPHKKVSHSPPKLTPSAHPQQPHQKPPMPRPTAKLQQSQVSPRVKNLISQNKTIPKQISDPPGSKVLQPTENSIPSKNQASSDVANEEEAVVESKNSSTIIDREQEQQSLKNFSTFHDDDREGINESKFLETTSQHNDHGVGDNPLDENISSKALIAVFSTDEHAIVAASNESLANESEDCKAISEKPASKAVLQITKGENHKDNAAAQTNATLLDEPEVLELLGDIVCDKDSDLSKISCIRNSNFHSSEQIYVASSPSLRLE